MPTFNLLSNTRGEPAEWRSAMFGMVPKWAKDTSIAKHTYNARSQTVMDKQSFKRTWYNNQFALIPVQTIFEPKYIDGKAHRYDIRRKDGDLFTGDAFIRSMTINADDHPFMSQFHKPKDEKRSIVVIKPQQRMDWLNMTHESAYKLLLPMSGDYLAEHCPKPKKPLKTAQIDVFSN